MRKKKLRNTRPKALFGEVAAAGITAAATLAAAGIGAAATAKAAKEQSAATIENAKQQAASIEATNINNNQLQQQSQQFIAQENEANRQIQRDLQMNLQLQGGALDTEQRRMASRIQVKKGGRVKSRKKLRDAQFPLWGSDTDIKVTDGGYLEYIGDSPEGYPLYKAHGDTHKQYHKVGKKYKSGIGIKVPGRETIEVENGETLADRLASPHGDVAIASRLSHNGLYPAQSIDAGAPVDDVIAAQEIVNLHNGNSPVRRNRYAALAGASTNYILPTDYPLNDLGFDMAGINVAAARRQLKKGGRCKAWAGTKYPMAYTSFSGTSSLTYPSNYGKPTYSLDYDKPDFSNPLYGYRGPDANNTTQTPKRSRWSGLSGNLVGAGLTTLGNIGGALLTNWGASRASRALNNAYLESGKILGNAYANLQTVDTSTLSRDMFRNQHWLPVVRSSNLNFNPEYESINRAFNRIMKATNAGTLSSAARLSRMAGANTMANEQRAKVSTEKANREEAIKQANIEQINKAAESNAQLDVQSRQNYMGHYLDLLKYNNDIVNERITGQAQAMSDAIMGGIGARANYMQAAGQSWGNAIAGSGQAFGNAFATDTAQRANIKMALAGASSTGQYNYYMSGDNYDRSGAYGVYSDYVAMSKSAKDSRDRDEWLFRANQLANKYGFPSV